MGESEVGSKNGSTGTTTVPIYRERGPDFEIFREMTRRFAEKDLLIKAQSAEIIAKSIEVSRQEARIMVLLDACPLGVIFVCNRIIEYVNHAICEITGYDREELLGKNTRILYETAGEWDIVGALQRGKGRTFKINVQFKRKDGVSVPCELQMTRVVDECDQEFIVLVYTQS